MKRLLALASVLMFMVCSGCGDTHESLTADAVSTMKDIVSTLEGIKDVDTAKSAKPKLKSLNEKLTELNKKQEKLPAPTEAEVKSMEAKYAKDMDEIGRKMMAENFRIMALPGVAAELQGINMNGK